MATPLTGGVGSDIARVTTNHKTFCVKFALPKLKVKADWFAPVHRNAAEYAWLKVAAEVTQEDALVLYGHSKQLQGFAMEFIAGDDSYLWKNNLLAEKPDDNEAAKVGELLGKIHSASSESEFDRGLFRNHDDFHALRIEPYLLHTAKQQPVVESQLSQLADELYSSQQVLVHGDASPKNIFFRAHNPILLDAECATIGDASFDPSFCLNHLVLKALHLPLSKSRYLTNALSLWTHYQPYIHWESSSETESRICRLLPALMLGRIDGKSPVEYLTEPQRELVRRISLHFIQSPVSQLDALITGIHERSQTMDNNA